MHPLLHMLQIGTLATWLSVAGFGLVGVIISQQHRPSPVVGNPDTQWVSEDFTLGGEPPSPSGPSAATPPAEPLPALPAPPEIPALTEFAPLPEIPDLPAPAPRKASPAATPSTRSTETPRQATSSTSRKSGTGTSSTRKPAGSGSGMSSAARLAAGNMSPPSYPAEARRRGQTGTVVVEFTVDGSGRVVSASAKSPSPWPLLNNEAVRTVRRWKFPPGPVTTFQRPIVFRLQ